MSLLYFYSVSFFVGACRWRSRPEWIAVVRALAVRLCHLVCRAPTNALYDLWQMAIGKVRNISLLRTSVRWFPEPNFISFRRSF